MIEDKKKLKKVVISGFILFVVAFVYSRAHDAISGAKLVIKDIEKYSEVTDPFVNIEGYMKRSTEIKVNGTIVPTDQTGNFNYPLALGTGYNSIEVKGTDSFGRTKVENFNIQVLNKNN
jgi:hypothetical protein